MTCSFRLIYDRMAKKHFAHVPWCWLLVYLHLGHLAASASSCIEVMSDNSLGLFCPTYSGPLPPEIPPGKKYSKLQIENADFAHAGAFLSKENFTGLEHLTFLRIMSSRLERINPDAFIHLQQLTHLDLSKNRLTFIEPGTFRGLKLRKLVLSGNLGLNLPTAAFSGAKIFNIVVKDCDIHSISYDLFEQTGTRHINLVNNRIRTLPSEFSAMVQPVDGIWGSIDLSNNSLDCDCRLLWLAQLLDKQRRFLDEGNTDYRSARQPRTANTGDDESFRPMYQLNLTCSFPKDLVQRRFPLPNEFDCPPPQVTEIDIAVLGKAMETVQLTCYAKGRPPPNVAWAFKQHNQEVHRIVKSPKQKRDEMADVSIGLNVSLREFQARDFACITWTDSGLNPSPNSLSNSQNSWLGGSPSSASSIVPRGPLSPDKAHRVAVRLRGLDLDSKDVNPAGISTQPTSNESLGEANDDNPNPEDFSPYQQLFVRRFTPLDLIGAILGTFVATLFLLFIVTRCIPHFYRRNSPNSKHTRLHYDGKQVSASLLKGDQKQEQDGTTNAQLHQPSTQYFADAATTVGSGSGPAYWPTQEYAYSSQEYDIPGQIDPLAGAMPLSPHPFMPIPNATGTLVRRVRPMSTASLHHSALQSPYPFPKSTMTAASTALILPPVATVPPLGIMSSPFLPHFSTAHHPTPPMQPPPIYFNHSQTMSQSTLPNGQ